VFGLSVRELFQIAHVGRSGRIVLLRVYLDESGHSDGPVCAVAGFAGDEERWTAFDSEWLKAIHPKTSLHMKDLRLGWNRASSRFGKLLERAGAVPHRCDLLAVGTTVFRRDYEEFVKGADWEDVFDPYMACFQFLLSEMLEGLGRDQLLHVFLEEQPKYLIRINALYEQVFNLRKQDQRLVGLTFLGKDQAVGFQAADYLAYHLAKDNTDPESQQAILTRPIKGQRGLGKRLHRENIARAAHAIRIAHRDIEADALALHKGSVCGD
jgi:hypothetical protein